MMTVLTMVALLTVPYAALSLLDRKQLVQLPEPRRGMVGLTLLFVFTGIGHFVQTDAMAQMLPPQVPWRVPIIYASGLLEFGLAAALLVPRTARAAAWCVIGFLVLTLPANVYAALERVPMGAHALGPVYLLVRVPLQVFIGWWAYRFGIREWHSAHGPVDHVSVSSSSVRAH